MSHALQLARRGLYTTDPNPRVGCLLVNESGILAEGWHQLAGGPHAEIHALQQAGVRAKGAVCYVTLEPCAHTGKTPPCTDALISAGISRVIAATVDPNPEVSGKGLARLQAAGIKTEMGLLQSQAQALNPGFESRMRIGRPYVRCKLAMSLDGRTAMATGESRWISGEAARMDVQRWRARSSAVMTGINTILADDPSLNVREIDLKNRQPLRAVFDTQLRMPTTAKLLTLPGDTLVFTGLDDLDKKQDLENAGATIIQLKARDEKEFLNETLKYLAEEQQINEILLETGATLAGSMLEVGLVDEIIIYVAPILMGDNAKALFKLPAIKAMSDKVQLEFSDIRMVGQDCRIIAGVRR